MLSADFGECGFHLQTPCGLSVDDMAIRDCRELGHRRQP